MKLTEIDPNIFAGVNRIMVELDILEFIDSLEQKPIFETILIRARTLTNNNLIIIEFCDQFAMRFAKCSGLDDKKELEIINEISEEFKVSRHKQNCFSKYHPQPAN